MALRKAAVIGAGLGGLSAAIRLARAGWEVDVFERQSGPGGKAFTTTVEGFRFDTGPSLLTMIHVLDQLFQEAGEQMADWLTPVPLSPLCRYVLSDDTVLNAHADPEQLAQEIQEKTDDTAVSVLDYLDYCRRIYEATEFLFLQKSLHEAGTYWDRRVLSALMRIGRIDPWRTMHKANQAFFRDPRVVQLFDRYATYNGSSPYMVPATLNIIPHVEFGLGGYAVEGGIYAIPKALAALAEKLGVRFHYETPVQSIGTRKGKITGIVVDAQRRDYPVVVSNADVMVTYRLLGDHSAPMLRRYHRQEPSSSGLVFYWGIKEQTPLEVNNILFGSDYPGEFQALFKEGRCPDDPTVYINITSRVSESDAPAGGENWFVLVNAPRDAGQDWESEVTRVREKVWQRVERALGSGVRSALVCEDVMTPADIAARTGSPGGSLYGISSNSRAAAFLRHPNRSRRHKGLYFCGGSAHPGGGMPLVILSGKIASDLVQKHEKT